MHRIVKISSPSLNYFIILGALLMYISIYFYLFPSLDTDIVLAGCIVGYPSKYIYIDLIVSLNSCKLGSLLLDIHLHLELYWPKCGECTRYLTTRNQRKTLGITLLCAGRFSTCNNTLLVICSKP